MKAEFDDYIKEYRKDQDSYLNATGESSEFFTIYKTQKLAEWLPEFFKGTPKTILDFGCGDGLMTEKVQKQFPETKLFGCDPSPESIKVAQKNHPEITFEVSGADLSCFKDEQFDVIFAAGVFHHIPFSEHAGYIQELHRVLTKNGVLILFELNPFNPGTQYIFNTCPIEKNAKMLNPLYARNLLKEYGSPTLKFYSFFPHFLRGFRCTEKFLTKVPLGGLYATFLKKEASKK
jgi:SAM-dependent methyltransferase